MKAWGYFLACLSAATYGAIPLFALPLMRMGIQFDSVLFYRFFIAASLIGIYLALKKVNMRVKRKELGALFALGGLFFFSSNFLFWSYDFMSAGIAATILFMYPVFVAIIMAIFFKEKISWITGCAILLAFSGVIFLNNDQSGYNISALGMLVVLASALAYALYIVVINKSPSIASMSGIKLTFYALAFNAVFFFIKALWKGGLQPITDTDSIIYILLFAIVCTIISTVSLTYAVQYIGSTPTAIMGAFEPVVAVIIGVSIFNEPMTSRLLLGITFIITAVVVLVLSKTIAKASHNMAKKVHSGLGKRKH